MDPARAGGRGRSYLLAGGTGAGRAAGCSGKAKAASPDDRESCVATRYRSILCTVERVRPSFPADLPDAVAAGLQPLSGLRQPAVIAPRPLGPGLPAASDADRGKRKGRLFVLSASAASSKRGIVHRSPKPRPSQDRNVQRSDRSRGALSVLCPNLGGDSAMCHTMEEIEFTASARSCAGRR